MRKSSSVLFLLFLAATPAISAPNPRSAVSLNGSDLNPCTVPSPCRSFSTAINATASGGEIVALDSAGYGPFSIFFTITVSGAPGVHAAITASSGDGINVNASANDRVTIRNLVLIGTGALNGIEQVQAGELRILNCLIRGFSNAGIETRSGGLSVDHSVVLDTLPGGLGISANSNGTDVVQMTISDSVVEGYSSGIVASGRASAMIVRCTVSHGLNGVVSVSQNGTGVTAKVTVESSTIVYNSGGIATIASGSNNTATMYIAQDEISYNTTGATKIGPGSIYSFANNRFTENGTDGGPFTVIAFQ
jgi:hypothetical protein